MSETIPQYHIHQSSQVWAASAANRVIERLAHAITEEAADMVPAAVANFDDMRDPIVATWADELIEVGESPTSEQAVLGAVLEYLHVHGVLKEHGYAKREEVAA